MVKKTNQKKLVTISQDQVREAVEELRSNGTNTASYIDDNKTGSIKKTIGLKLSNKAPEDNINTNQFREEFPGVEGSGSSIVFIDSGIDLDHSMFGSDNNGDGVADRIVYQYDFADKDTNASDVTGNGSNVASVAAGSTTPYGDSSLTGIAPGANIIALKVISDSGIGSFNNIEKALQWVVANAATYNIASVNISIGDKQNWSVQSSRYGIGDELAQLKNLNVMPVAGSGSNFYKFNSVYGVAYPSSDPSVFSIGATYESNIGPVAYGSGAEAYSTKADQIAPFSQRDPNLTTVFAPGAGIAGANATGGFVTMHGTNQASAVVSGVVVLAQELAVQRLGRRLSFEEIKNLLQSTGVTIYDGDDEDDNVQNPPSPQAYKRVDVDALAQEITNLPPPGSVIHTLATTSNSLAEGNSGSTLLSYTITRSGSINTASSVNYKLSGTATLNADYTLQNVDGQNVTVSGNTIYFTPDSTTATITLMVLGDVVDEVDETIIVNLSNGVAAGGANLVNANLKTTIVNDDLVSFSVSDVTIIEGKTGVTTANFVVSLSNPSTLITRVNYATQSVTATPASDYLDRSGTLTFSPGQTRQTLAVSVLGDEIFEPDEIFNLALSNQTRGTLDKAIAVATITNDDALITATPSNLSIIEGDSGTKLANFVVRLNSPSSKAINLQFATANGTASNLSDYLATSGNLTFAAGATIKTISVAVRGDTEYEANETFWVNLSNAVGANISTPSVMGTIVNNDPVPVIDYQILGTTPSISEGVTGTSSLVNFIINRQGFTAISSSIRYGFSGSANQWSDYQVVGVTGNGVTNTGATVNFAPVATVATLTLRVIGDRTYELDETINVSLSSPSTTTATLSSPLATTVISNDEVLPSLRVDNLNITEGNLAPKSVNFFVRLSGNSSMPITVKFNTVDGSASSGSDYTAISGTLTFAPLEIIKSVTVAIIGDTNFEANETLSLNLSNPVGASLDSSGGLGTILNDDLTITGSDAPDVLVGDWQNNILTGGKGADTLSGGFGVDQFVYNNLDERSDLITDFRVTQEKIVLTNLLSSLGYKGNNPIGDGWVKCAASSSGAMVQIDPDGASGALIPVSLLTVQHTSVTNLNNPANFVF